MKTLCSATALLAACTAFAAPLKWTCDWPEAKAQSFTLYQGETATFEPTFRINGQVATNLAVEAVWYQTNGMDSAWWRLDNATFAPSNDVGAAAYRFFVEARGTGAKIYRANGTLRMLPSPGFTPGALPLPVSSIDFSQVAALNAPWLLPGATNDIGTIKVELGSISNSVSTLSAAGATNSADIAAINSKIPGEASASNQLADKAWIDDEIDTYAAYYITYTAAGAAFPTRAALLNATVVYSGGAARTPTRNDYAVVLADESHGGAEWRYIYTVAAGATSGQWDAQYPIETNDYDALANKPQINGTTLTGNKTGADLGLATPANVAAAALAATNYTDAAAALKSRTALGGFVTSPSTFVDGEETYTSQLPSWDDSGSDGAGWYVYNDGFSRIEFLSDNPNAPILTWFVSMIDYHEFVATRQTVVIPGYILGAQTNAPLASADMALTNSTDIAALASRLSQVSQSATNYTDASISPTSPAFSNAVLSVGLGIDTNTVAAINELVDSAHDLPVSGATSVGALLLALAAAIAALKKNLRYSFNDVTVSNGSTTLADRAVNRLQLSSSLAGLNVVFPAAAYATKARDFFLRIDLGSGVSLLDVSFSLPSGEQNTLYLENSSGELPEIPEGGSTILYFSETTSGRFLVKAEELMTISQEDQE